MEIVPSAPSYFRVGPDSRAIEAASKELSGATSPVLLIGDGVARSQAVAEAVRLAEALGAKVYATAFSEVTFRPAHPQFLGQINPAMPESKELLAAADAVLAVGTSVFSGFFYFSGSVLGRDTKLIHIDSNAGEIGKSEPTDIGILADPKVAMAELAEAIDADMSGSAKEAAKGRAVSASEAKAAKNTAWQRSVKDRWDLSPMSAERMMTEIAAPFPPTPSSPTTP